MSGYCNECGNQHCICDEIKKHNETNKIKEKDDNPDIDYSIADVFMEIFGFYRRRN